jgi:hypothetical protein
MIETTMVIPYDKGHLLGQLRTKAGIINESYDETGTEVTFKTFPETLTWLQKKIELGSDQANHFNGPGVTHLKGSQEIKHLSMKKFSFFSIDASYPSRQPRFRSWIHARYFFFIGLRTIFTDPHQSPIRFKAIVF